MKKIILFSSFIFLFSVCFSQQDSILKSKSGKVILPQKGDYAVGIGANSIFNYIGNMLSSSGNNQLHLNLLNNNMLYGKYFLTSQSAIRLKLMINQTNSHYENNNVPDDINANNKVTDKYDQSYTNFGFTIGYEKRKGSGRLQVSYGAEINFSRNSTESKYTYGNAFSANNTSPTSTYDFINSFSSSAPSRPIENKQDNGIGLGIRVFTGLEYFIFPKISIGGEIGLGYNNNFNGKNINNSESWNFNSVLNKNNPNKNSSSSLNTDIFNGQIFLLFHFK